MTIVPPMSMSFRFGPERLKRMKPDGGLPSTTQVREFAPGSVAVTEMVPGVPAPVGIATVTDPISSPEPAVLVFVTVIV